MAIDRSFNGVGASIAPSVLIINNNASVPVTIGGLHAGRCRLSCLLTVRDVWVISAAIPWDLRKITNNPKMAQVSFIEERHSWPSI